MTISPEQVADRLESSIQHRSPTGWSISIDRQRYYRGTAGLLFSAVCFGKHGNIVANVGFGSRRPSKEEIHALAGRVVRQFKRVKVRGPYSYVLDTIH
jgi:hypothetical protein